MESTKVETTEKPALNKGAVMLSFLALIARKLNFNTIERRLYNIPKYYRKLWYNQAVHSRSTKYPIVFDKDEKYISCNEGLEVVMGETKDGRLIYYKIVKTYYRSADWLYDSDGFSCDLKFSRIGTPKN